MSTITADLIRGKRLMAIDYGVSRTGIAVCDEMHIVVSLRPVIPTDDQIVPRIVEQSLREGIGLIIVGVPFHHDGRVTPIIEMIQKFVAILTEASMIPVVTADEAFSTQDARAIMVQSGMKKKKRQTKGVKDQVAAAVILKRVIEEVSMR